MQAFTSILHKQVRKQHSAFLLFGFAISKTVRLRVKKQHWKQNMFHFSLQNLIKVFFDSVNISKSGVAETHMRSHPAYVIAVRF